MEQLRRDGDWNMIGVSNKSTERGFRQQQYEHQECRINDFYNRHEVPTVLNLYSPFPKITTSFQHDTQVITILNPKENVDDISPLDFPDPPSNLSLNNKMKTISRQTSQKRFDSNARRLKLLDEPSTPGIYTRQHHDENSTLFDMPSTLSQAETSALRSRLSSKDLPQSHKNSPHTILYNVAPELNQHHNKTELLSSVSNYSSRQASVATARASSSLDHHKSSTKEVDSSWRKHRKTNGDDFLESMLGVYPEKHNLGVGISVADKMASKLFRTNIFKSSKSKAFTKSLSRAKQSSSRGAGVDPRILAKAKVHDVHTINLKGGKYDKRREPDPSERDPKVSSVEQGICHFGFSRARLTSSDTLDVARSRSLKPKRDKYDVHIGQTFMDEATTEWPEEIEDDHAVGDPMKYEEVRVRQKMLEMRIKELQREHASLLKGNLGISPSTNTSLKLDAKHNKLSHFQEERRKGQQDKEMSLDTPAHVSSVTPQTTLPPESLEAYASRPLPVLPKDAYISPSTSTSIASRQTKKRYSKQNIKLATTLHVQVGPLVSPISTTPVEHRRQPSSLLQDDILDADNILGWVDGLQFPDINTKDKEDGHFGAPSSKRLYSVEYIDTVAVERVGVDESHFCVLEDQKIKGMQKACRQRRKGRKVKERFIVGQDGKEEFGLSRRVDVVV